jgi:hypothetical protein
VFCWPASRNASRIASAATADRAAWAALALILDADGKCALEAASRIDYVQSNFASDNSLLRPVPHLKLASCNFRRGDNFKIGEWHEVPDFQFAPAHDGQGRRLHATNADNPPRTLPKNDGRGARE